MKCHKFIDGTIKKSIVIAILNLIFHLFVLIGQIIILADLETRISLHNFVLYKYKSMHVFTGKRIGTTWSPYKMLVYEIYIKN